ncbi:hypothetical protein EG68_01114 [Paragonimus skrjabini miyazakii]|uniref:Cleavage and polyadenylation specificity factor subunit 6 n=1 Tax=Paragonimus skrjabini miyazakii TaxID=59628 RepID=A0A8S9Z3C3_9TREM|nr:hypothetical protein EG68_01114 [Paragonimus skrjabini miyazakii]
MRILYRYASFFQLTVQECSDLTELYDDVIAPSTSEAAITAQSVVPSLNNMGLHNGRRIATYVGNLTWWTTDQDLLEAANKLGINDVIEIKFHENRQNGQSKGFCAMVFGSEQSVRVAMDKMPKTEIHGQKPVVTHCTKQNLSIFEKASGGDSQQTSRSRSDESSGKSSGLSAATGSVNSSTSRAPPLMATPTMPASLGFSLRNNSSLMGQATPNLRQMANALPNTLQQALATQTLHAGLSGGGHLGQLTLNLPTVSGVLMTPSIPPPPLPGNTSSLLPTAFNLPNTISTSLTSGTAQVNHNFFSQAIHAQGALPTPVPAPASLLSLNTSNSQASVRSQFDNYGRPVIHTYTPSSSGKLSESDFEDILQRNKTVSSSAINRAVQDAASGDYASAIETLVTAISLIKQSKIASDDRCRILINSLQDTLHGIESKSYGTKSSSRRRRRSYSDSGSDDGMDEYGSSSATSGRRHRDRGNRSRSRDRHDRHRHSRDRTAGSNTSYYGSQSSMQLPSGTGLSSGISISSVGNSGQGNCSGNSTTSSDRYRDSRYRH